MLFFTEIRTNNSEISMGPQKTLKSQSNLENKGNRVIALPDSKLFYKTVVMRTEWG